MLCCIRIVQAVALRGTTVDFQFIAYTVSVRIVQAIAIAIVCEFWVVTSIVINSVGIIIARRFICTSTRIGQESKSEISILR